MAEPLLRLNAVALERPDISGLKAKAIDVVKRGLENIPAYDAPGKSRLTMSLQQIESITDESLKVDEEPAPAADAAN